MRVGLQIPHFYSAGGTEHIGQWLADVARAADESGFDSIWLMDHFFQLGGFDWLSPVEGPMLEGYASLGFLAAATRRARLGLLVTGVVYRDPGLLVKTVTTIDVLSGGRAAFGIGAAWYEEEARGLGLPFPPLRERYERMEETLEIAKRMWAGDERPYQGRHYRLDRPLNSPPAISRPHPPILIGGSGPRRTLRLVAQHADACNLSGTYYEPVETIAGQLAVLREHCEAVGRRYDEIERTVLDTFDVSNDAGVDDAVRRCEALAGVSIQTVLVNIPHAFGVEDVQRLARVVTAVADF